MVWLFIIVIIIHIIVSQHVVPVIAQKYVIVIFLSFVLVVLLHQVVKFFFVVLVDIYTNFGLSLVLVILVFHVKGVSWLLWMEKWLAKRCILLLLIIIIRLELLWLSHILLNIALPVVILVSWR